jgi:hypothetical protein
MLTTTEQLLKHEIVRLKRVIESQALARSVPIPEAQGMSYEELQTAVTGTKVTNATGDVFVKVSSELVNCSNCDGFWCCIRTGVLQHYSALKGVPVNG